MAKRLTGRVIDFNHPNKSSVTDTYPITGNHLKYTANARINMNPSQNPGTEIPKAANIWMPRSHRDPALHAAKTPMGIPRSTARVPPTIVREMVGSNLWPTSSATVLPEYIDFPKSPLSVRPAHSQNWVVTGLSSPNSARMSFTSSGPA